MTSSNLLSENLFLRKNKIGYNASYYNYNLLKVIVSKFATSAVSLHNIAIV